MDLFLDGSKEDTGVGNFVLQETPQNPWTEKKNNKEIIEMADVGQRLLQQLMKRKLGYAGHIMRGSSEPLLQLCLEGKSKAREDGAGQEGTGWTMLRNGQGRQAMEIRNGRPRTKKNGQTWLPTFGPNLSPENVPWRNKKTYHLCGSRSEVFRMEYASCETSIILLIGETKLRQTWRY
ncbi:RNA-directed DNA polymerase from mobile element jockey [Elysia marginata]|uniref:RNA-directed DNA polymerase from mobile element jockey n=1 Tax=Elysia marginata TaxID=1093978 RepID=A0AAV4GI79_9GAST|nr:RNA-directed DNA polymerase from mobile element jockey [Elysia marginata]